MNKDNLHPYIDPKLEARLVALVLGEASDFEREDLERLISENADLAVFVKRIEAVQDLLHSISTDETEIDDDDWKLSDNRRASLLDAFEGEPAPAEDGVVAAPASASTPPRPATRWQLASVAALFCILGIVGTMIFIPLLGGRRPQALAMTTESYRDRSEFGAYMWKKQSPDSTMSSVEAEIDAEIDAASPAVAFQSAPRAAGLSYSQSVDGFEEDFRRVPARPAAGANRSHLGGGLGGGLGAGGSGAGASDASSLSITVPSEGRIGQVALQQLMVEGDDLAVAGQAIKSALAAADTNTSGQTKSLRELQERLEDVRGQLAATTRSKTKLEAETQVAEGLVMTGGAKPAPAPQEIAAIAELADVELKITADVAPPAIVAGKPLATLAPHAAPNPAAQPAAPAAKKVNVLTAGAGGSVSTPVIINGPSRTILGRKAASSDQPMPSLGEAPVVGVEIAGVAGNPKEKLERLGEIATDKQVRDHTRMDADGGLTVNFQENKKLARKADENQRGFSNAEEARGASLRPTPIVSTEPAQPASGNPMPGLKELLADNESAPRPDLEKSKSKDSAEDAVELTVARDLLTRAYVVPPDFLKLGEAGDYEDSFAAKPAPAPDPTGEKGQALMARTTAKDVLENMGITFPEGSSAFFNPSTSELVIRNTRPNAQLVETLVDSLRIDETAPLFDDLQETSAAAEPFSTFSLHVSDVSFKLAQAALARGEWPDASRVRIEEFVNAFDYGDPPPSRDDIVACQLEQAAHPFLQQRNLLRVSMRTAAAGRSADTPLRLTILLDNSGSMERADRRETVQRAFGVLASQLQANDQLTLLGFARQPHLLADRFDGLRGGELLEIVKNVPSEGGTNLEAALQLAFEKAREQQSENAQNRIVLLTDGAANLGDAKPLRLSSTIESMRDAGIAFDAAGIGADGLNDEILEALTRKGDGRYYLLDRPEDADEGFARQIAGALRPSAKNVKIQVEFNPKRVGHYKLLGFEKHRLDKEDFRDDSVDAAEMAAEEAGVAVYQFEPLPGGEGDIGSVSVRFQDLSSGQMVEKRWPIAYDSTAPRTAEAAPPLRIATAASLFATRLKGGPAAEAVDLGGLTSILAGLPQRYREMERVRQLRDMIEQARQLAGE